MYDPKVYSDKDIETIKEELRDEGYDPEEKIHDPGFEYPLHDHPETKVLVIINGSMTVDAAGQTYTCTEGDRLFIPGNTPHSATVGEDGCTFLWAEKL